MEKMIERQQELLNLAKSEGRDFTEEEKKEFDKLTNDINDAKAKADAEALDKAKIDAVNAERTRVAEITALCKSFNVDPSDYIKNGKTIEEVKTMTLEKLKNSQSPVEQNGNFNATETGREKFIKDAAEGIFNRATGEGNVNMFTGMSIRKLAEKAFKQDGVDVVDKSNDEVLEMMSRQFMNPSAAFPAILDEAINKSIKEVYKSKPTTYQEWVAEGSVSDFKSTKDHEYVMGGGKFEKVVEGGEIKTSKLDTELLPQRKIDTYATQFGLTREAFYNDDIGFIANMPRKYTIRALKTIDEQVYTLLFDNPAIYDGKNLFHADHKNLAGSGSAPSEQSLSDIKLMMAKQTDQFNDPILLAPEYIICPPEYSITFYKLFNSQYVVGSNNNDVNPFYASNIKIIETPWISAKAGANAKPWFVVCNKNFAKSIQVDYLNGQKTPTFRRMEVAGRLGYVWDIYMDWGVSVVDFRGIYKNGGVA